MLAGTPAWALEGKEYADWEQFKPVLTAHVAALKETDLVLVFL